MPKSSKPQKAAPDKPLAYGSSLTIGAAKKMLEAGEKEAVAQGVPMSIAICDAGGHLIAFHRMDYAPLNSIQIAMDKSYTAVFGKMGTGAWKQLFQNEIVPLHFHERWITFMGGFPVIKGNAIVGGIGVSGGRIEDLYVAKAALKAGGFIVKEVDSALAQKKAVAK